MLEGWNIEFSDITLSTLHNFVFRQRDNANKGNQMFFNTTNNHSIGGLIVIFLSGAFLLTAEAQVTFEDVSDAVGLGGTGGQVSWVDFDKDGWTDVQAGGLWRNEEGKKFVNVGPAGSMNSWCDFDNDGNLDFFDASPGVANFGSGDGTFTTVPMPDRPMAVSLGAVCLDIDGDGFVDVYAGGYENWGVVDHYPDAIFMNKGGREFVLTTWTTENAYQARGVTAADYNNDGATDLFVSNYRLRGNILWRNAKGPGQAGGFDFASVEAGVLGEGSHTIGSAWGDIDNDGLIDLFVGNFAHGGQPQSRFYRNLGAEKNYAFEKKGTCGVGYQESYASPALGDYDNDGDLDLYFTTVYGHNHARMYRNEGNWNFVDVTGEAGLGGMSSTYQGAWADYDNDGDLDLMTGGRLRRNNGTNGNWLKVRLEAAGKVNRAAIGAQVRLKLGDRTLMRQVESSTGQGNMNDLTLHFGLGTHEAPVELEISWPYTKAKQLVTAKVNTVVSVTMDVE